MPLGASGDAGEVERLLASRADVDHVDSRRRTPLYVACEKGNTACALLLLQTGHAKVNVKTAGWKGGTALHIACQKGNTHCVSLLLDVGKADVNEENMFGRTPLMSGCSGGHSACAALLLETNRCDVNRANNLGNTALQLARADVTCIDLLVEAKANVDLQNCAGNTALMWAAKDAEVGGVGALLAHGADEGIVNNAGLKPLHEVGATWRDLNVPTEEDQKRCELVSALLRTASDGTRRAQLRREAADRHAVRQADRARQKAQAAAEAAKQLDMLCPYMPRDVGRVVLAYTEMQLWWSQVWSGGPAGTYKYDV